MKCRQKEAGKARRIRMYCGAAASKGNEVAIFCFENPSPPMLFYRECFTGTYVLVGNVSTVHSAVDNNFIVKNNHYFCHT